MDRYTADKGVDKTAFIILSLVTDKQVWVFFFFYETLKNESTGFATMGEMFL